MPTQLDGRIARLTEEFQAELRASLAALRPPGNGDQPFVAQDPPPGSFTAMEGIHRRPPDGSPNFGSNAYGWRLKKLDLPVFEGKNPDGWILRAER